MGIWKTARIKVMFFISREIVKITSESKILVRFKLGVGFGVNTKYSQTVSLSFH